METNKQLLPPYQINVRHSAVFWKSEHNFNYISVNFFKYNFIYLLSTETYFLSVAPA